MKGNMVEANENKQIGKTVSKIYEMIKRLSLDRPGMDRDTLEAMGKAAKDVVDASIKRAESDKEEKVNGNSILQYAVLDLIRLEEYVRELRAAVEEESKVSQ